MASAKPKVSRYEVGTNDRLDALLDENETVFIVNGPKGRIPISADSAEEALVRYAERFATKEDSTQYN